MFSFSLETMHIFNSFLISSVICWLFRSVLFSLHMFSIFNSFIFPAVVGCLVAKSFPTLVAPWTVACQTPLSVELSRPEYWSWLPFPSPENLPNSGIEPGSPALQADSLPTELQGKPPHL